MQIMKLLPAVCAAALGASFISAHAGDTPVQAAARAAFEQEMKALDKSQTNQSATNLAKPAPAKTATTQTAPKPSPAPAAKPVVTAPHPAAAAAVVPAAAAAAIVAPAETAPATNSAEAAPATPPPAETKAAEPTPESGAVAPVPAAVLIASPATTPVPGVPNSKSQVTAVIPGKELGLRSIEAPLVPITETQLQELHDLLAKYKLNEITPAEYHRQRAEILGQSRP
jgi:hypothetical protein